MKIFAVLSVFAAAAMFAAPCAIAQDHVVSASALSSLGLGGMEKVPLAQGMSVRGHGSFASVGGGSWAFGGIILHTEEGTLAMGGIDADAYSAVDRSHHGSAHAKATPRGAAVRIPEVEIVLSEANDAGDLVPVGSLTIRGGVASGNSALRSPINPSAWAGARKSYQRPVRRFRW